MRLALLYLTDLYVIISSMLYDLKAFEKLLMDMESSIPTMPT